jgi:carbonic anhydrase
MKKTIIFIVYLSFFVISSCKSNDKKNNPLNELIKGNQRYINNKAIHPNQNQEIRLRLSSNQEPFATIIGCSDSRVPPEIIFDQGLEDLFVVRVAGNVIGKIELESIEFSATQLNSKLIVVLGHENCGAIDSVIKHQTKDIEEIARLITPSVEEVFQEKSDNVLELAIKSNAINMKRYLEKTPAIAELISKDKIKIVAAYYNFKTGKVELL